MKMYELHYWMLMIEGNTTSDHCIAVLNNYNVIILKQIMLTLSFLLSVFLVEAIDTLLNAEIQ